MKFSRYMNLKRLSHTCNVFGMSFHWDVRKWIHGLWQNLHTTSTVQSHAARLHQANTLVYSGEFKIRCGESCMQSSLSCFDWSLLAYGTMQMCCNALLASMSVCAIACEHKISVCAPQVHLKDRQTWGTQCKNASAQIHRHTEIRRRKDGQRGHLCLDFLILWFHIRICWHFLFSIL